MSSSSLSIRQIREILDANGTNYSDCIEKEDYVRKLDQVRSGAKPDSAYQSDKGPAPSSGFKGFGGATQQNRSSSPPPSYTHSSGSTSGGSSSSGSSRSSNSSHNNDSNRSRQTGRRKSREEDSGSRNTSNDTDPEAIIKRVSKTTDYYIILGISRSASEDEVKKAYKKLALKLHPDKCKLPGAEEAFKKLAGAFNCLGNPEKRNHYDRSGTDPSVGAGGPGGGGTVDPNDIFRAFFGGGGMPGNMHFQFGGGHDFEQFFQQHQRPRQTPRRQEGRHVEEQNGLSSSLLRLAPIALVLFLPSVTGMLSSVIRNPWLLLPAAFLVPAKFQKPLFMAAAIIFIMNLI